MRNYDVGDRVRWVALYQRGTGVVVEVHTNFYLVQVDEPNDIILAPGQVRPIRLSFIGAELTPEEP